MTTYYDNLLLKVEYYDQLIIELSTLSSFTEYVKASREARNNVLVRMNFIGSTTYMSSFDTIIVKVPWANGNTFSPFVLLKTVNDYFKPLKSLHKPWKLVDITEDFPWHYIKPEGFDDDTRDALTVRNFVKSLASTSSSYFLKRKNYEKLKHIFEKFPFLSIYDVGKFLDAFGEQKTHILLSRLTKPFTDIKAAYKNASKEFIINYFGELAGLTHDENVLLVEFTTGAPITIKDPKAQGKIVGITDSLFSELKNTLDYEELYLWLDKRGEVYSLLTDQQKTEYSLQTGYYDSDVPADVVRKEFEKLLASGSDKIKPSGFTRLIIDDISEEDIISYLDTAIHQDLENVFVSIVSSIGRVIDYNKKLISVLLLVANDKKYEKYRIIALKELMTTDFTAYAKYLQQFYDNISVELGIELYNNKFENKPVVDIHRISHELLPMAVNKGLVTQRELYGLYTETGDNRLFNLMSMETLESVNPGELVKYFMANSPSENVLKYIRNSYKHQNLVVDLSTDSPLLSEIGIVIATRRFFGQLTGGKEASPETELTHNDRELYNRLRM